MILFWALRERLVWPSPDPGAGVGFSGMVRFLLVVGLVLLPELRHALRAGSGSHLPRVKNCSTQIAISAGGKTFPEGPLKIIFGPAGTSGTPAWAFCSPGRLFGTPACLLSTPASFRGSPGMERGAPAESWRIPAQLWRAPAREARTPAGKCRAPAGSTTHQMGKNRTGEASAGSFPAHFPRA